MPASLTLVSTQASPVIPVSGEPRLVYVLVEIKGGEGAQTLPAHVGLVIDCSESMRIRLVTDEQFAQLVRHGQAREVMKDGVPAWQINAIPSEQVRQFPRKIDYVSDALVTVSEYLRPTDFYSLVAFASEAVTLIPHANGSERGRLQQAARSLENLNLGDETHLAGGLALAFDELHRQQDKSSAARLILLTDGYTRNVSDVYDLARRAHEAGLALTTMGLGSEFNEDLLIPLADLTGGNAYYIETPEQISAAFRKELGAALRVSYRNVKVHLHLPAGVTLHRVHRVLPELGLLTPAVGPSGVSSLRLGHFDPAAPTALLLELILPPWQAGSYRLAQAVLSWDPENEGDTQPNQRQEWVTDLSSSSTIRYDPVVMKVVDKVGAYRLGTLAIQAAQQGDRDAAVTRLQQAAARLRELGETALASIMLDQARHVEHLGMPDPNTTKKLVYETRHLSQTLAE